MAYHLRFRWLSDNPWSYEPEARAPALLQRVGLHSEERVIESAVNQHLDSLEPQHRENRLVFYIKLYPAQNIKPDAVVRFAKRWQTVNETRKTQNKSPVYLFIILSSDGTTRGWLRKLLPRDPLGDLSTAIHTKLKNENMQDSLLPKLKSPNAELFVEWTENYLTKDLKAQLQHKCLKAKDPKSQKTKAPEISVLDKVKASFADGKGIAHGTLKETLLETLQEAFSSKSS